MIRTTLPKGKFGNVDYVFVYGTLKQKWNNNIVLQDSPLIIKHAKTVHKYNMYDLGPFPAVIESDKYGTNIIGEVYHVQDDTVKKQLDTLEGYPQLYYRKIVEIKNYRKFMSKNVNAWMYFFNASYNEMEERVVQSHVVKLTSGEWTGAYRKYPKG